MIPKEKATELYNKFYNLYPPSCSVKVRHRIAKESAMIVCDEVLKSKPLSFQGITPEGRDACYTMSRWAEGFWTEVKHEIEKL